MYFYNTNNKTSAVFHKNLQSLIRLAEKENEPIIIRNNIGVGIKTVNGHL